MKKLMKHHKSKMVYFSFSDIPASQHQCDKHINEENNIPVRYFGETIDLTSKGISLPKLVQILVREVLN